MKKNPLSLEDVKGLLKFEIECFANDSTNKKYGKEARLLKKHYERILLTLEKVKKL